jgi:hypothetical protein
MGYETELRGELMIQPLLRWAQYKDSQHLGLDNAKKNNKSLYLLESSTPVETEEGILERRQAYGLGFAWPYPVKMYDILEELQALVDAVGPEHRITGEMRAEGSDFADIWKLTVVAGRAVRLIPTITWPDGTVEASRYQQ